MMLRGPALYTVHRKPGTLLDKDLPVFVREGFSIPAFLLTILWALYHRLWLVAGGLLGIQFLAVLLQEAHALNEVQSAIIIFGLQLLFGFHANDFLRAKLKKRGYILAALVSGDSKFRAEQRYFEQALGAHA